MNLAMDSETVEAAAADWFAKQRSDDWTDADETALDAWLDQATAHRVAFIRLTAAWQHAARLRALGAGVPAGVIPARNSWNFSPLFNRGANPGASVEMNNPGTSWLAPLGKIAASVLLVLGIGATAWYLIADPASRYETKIGATENIPLPDGSRVTLNTASKIRVALNETERRIELEKGEAFFDVAKDTQRLFTVVAGNKRVVAVGTKFSVRREADNVRVIVTEGRVRLEDIEDVKAPPTQLDAGAVAETKETAVRVQRRPLPEVEQLLSWRTGYVTFRDTDLAEAVAEFNRYSPRKITIKDPQIAHIRIGGNFRTDNVEAFLWLLENGFPVNIEERGDGIELTAR